METRLDFALIEYQKLRDESMQAMQAQQSTLQWSIAAFGAIIAGTLVVIVQKGSRPTPTESFVALGIVIPAFVICCGMAWVGELFRMERIGVYLRGLETEMAKVVREVKQSDAGAGSNPLTLTPMWELFIATPSRREMGITKQRIGYIGSVGIYILALMGCLVTCVWYLWADKEGALDLKIIYSILCATEFAGYFRFGVYLGHNLGNASRSVAHVPRLESSLDAQFQFLIRVDGHGRRNPP